MTKEEAKKWGLILLAYGFGDKCRVEVKEGRINAVPLSDLYIVDSGDHDISEDDYKIMERKNPLVPDCCIDKRLWEYTSEKEKIGSEKCVVEKLLLKKTDIYEFAKNIILQELHGDKEESDYYGFIRVSSEKEYKWRKQAVY